MKRYKNYLINLIFPAFVFGSVTGVLTAFVILVYKLCAKYVISFSETGYHYLGENLWLVPIIAAALFGISFLVAFIYKKLPYIKGGGIPTSIGVSRGILPFRWFLSLVGTFVMSLFSFLIGVPLGNEGPSVLMGTALGRGAVAPFYKKHRAWSRYSMTGGACAGFSVATGAPISGVVFAIEEAHQRISPMIIIVSSTSVMFSYITTEIFGSFFGVDARLFPKLNLTALNVSDVWIPLVVGIVVGLFSVLFLKLYGLLSKLFNKKLSKVPTQYKIFAILLATLALGVCSHSFISTGHELMLSLFESSPAIYLLLIILLVRSVLTLSGNVNGITGGMFVPLLALGAVLAGAVGKALCTSFSLSNEYYTVILVLGITACIAGMMKMPLTAILFALEALSCYNNILYVLVAAGVSFVITEIFSVKSINDIALENRVEEIDEDKQVRVVDTFVTVQNGAFAVGKQIRDIFWPANLFVLSVKRESEAAKVDEHGGKFLNEGDVLHVRYSTTDEAVLREELMSIVGEQTFSEKTTDII